MNTLVSTSGNEQGAMSAMSRLILWLCLGWFFTVLGLALSGGFITMAGERPVLILLAVTLPVALYGLGYYRIEAFREWVLGIDMRRLILLHSWRMVGMGFVFLYFYDQLPALFALPAGLGDATAAAAALIIGISMYENTALVSRRRIFMWNTFGLADFVIAVSLGVLTRSGELLHSSGQVSSDIMTAFPLALIPGFGVPLYVITHLMIYAQLKHNKH